MPQRPAEMSIRRLSAEQSNSSMIIDEQLVLKVVRKVLSGVHPEAEISRYLTVHGYSNAPPLFGEVTRFEPDGTPNTLMLVQGFVRNQGDGWEWTLEFLAQAAEESVDVGEDGEQEQHADLYSNYAGFAQALGRRLAQLHEVLSQPTDDPAFRPEVVTEADLDGWATGAIEQLERAMPALRRLTDGPEDDGIANLARDVVGRQSQLQGLIRRLAASGTGALRTRVHGDFHLGQVLVTGGDAYLIDFEGEPAKSMEQRRAHSSGLRDVAGMLRSFDYAAATASSRLHSSSERTAERRETLVEQFRARAGADFLAAYREVLEASPHRWAPRAAEQSLLDLFLLEKAAYEIRYEADNRPDWIGIPLGGLDQIIKRLLGSAARTGA